MITGAAQMDGACLKVVPAAKKKKVVAREFYDEYEY
jgi:translation elongation factor EF-Tu-like GTPase